MVRLSKINLVCTFSIILLIFLAYFVTRSAQADDSDGRISELVTSKAGLDMTTDRVRYKKGDKITLQVTNLMKNSIWYIKNICPPSCCYLYRYENEQWKNMGNPMPCTQFIQPPSEIIHNVNPN